jgi:hypothetical protein
LALSAFEIRLALLEKGADAFNLVFAAERESEKIRFATDQHTGFGRCVQGIQRVKNFVTGELIQSVPLIRPVDGQQGNAVARLKKNVLVYHAVSHYMETATDLIPIKFLPPRAEPYARCPGEYLEHWAAEKPIDVFLAQPEIGLEQH